MQTNFRTHVHGSKKWYSDKTEQEDMELRNVVSRQSVHSLTSATDSGSFCSMCPNRSALNSAKVVRFYSTSSNATAGSVQPSTTTICNHCGQQISHRSASQVSIATSWGSQSPLATSRSTPGVSPGHAVSKSSIPIAPHHMLHSAQGPSPRILTTTPRTAVSNQCSIAAPLVPQSTIINPRSTG